MMLFSFHQHYIPSTMAYLPSLSSQIGFRILITSIKWGLPPNPMPLHTLFFLFLQTYALSYSPLVSKIDKRCSRRVALQPTLMLEITPRLIVGMYQSHWVSEIKLEAALLDLFFLHHKQCGLNSFPEKALHSHRLWCVGDMARKYLESTIM